MIRVVYDGNLGNRLFQYCFGRLIAERMGYRLDADPIDGFPRTRELVDGKIYRSDMPLILRGQRPDLSFLDGADPQHEIILTGYFQRYEYYATRARDVRRWLRMEPVPSGTAVGDRDVVVGIRRGRDYIPRHGIPLSYFEQALARLDHDQVYICTDVFADPMVRCLAKRHDAIVRPPGALDNLAFIKQFNKIVISNSTFLWWGAFLSDAKEIIFPRPANGFWSNADEQSKNIALEIPDRRYVYLESGRYRSEFLSECVQNVYDDTVVTLKGLVRPMLAKFRRPKRSESRWLFHED
jgi:hypothetical protein